jgi:hypothetical protein
MTFDGTLHAKLVVCNMDSDLLLFLCIGTLCAVNFFLTCKE